MCVGDSNTASYFAGVASWCDRLAAEHPALDWHNLAVSGATAIPKGGLYPGPKEVTDALAMAPDVVLVALGTNDLRFGAEADAVAAALLAFDAQIHAAGRFPSSPQCRPS